MELRGGPAVASGSSLQLWRLWHSDTSHVPHTAHLVSARHIHWLYHSIRCELCHCCCCCCYLRVGADRHITPLACANCD